MNKIKNTVDYIMEKFPGSKVVGGYLRGGYMTTETRTRRRNPQVEEPEDETRNDVIDVVKGLADDIFQIKEDIRAIKLAMGRQNRSYNSYNSAKLDHNGPATKKQIDKIGELIDQLYGGDIDEVFDKANLPMNITRLEDLTVKDAQAVFNVLKAHRNYNKRPRIGSGR